MARTHRSHDSSTSSERRQRLAAKDLNRRSASTAEEEHPRIRPALKGRRVSSERVGVSMDFMREIYGY